MNLNSTIKAYGTSEGAHKGWEHRSRTYVGRKEEEGGRLGSRHPLVALRRMGYREASSTADRGRLRSTTLEHPSGGRAEWKDQYGGTHGFLKLDAPESHHAMLRQGTDVRMHRSERPASAAQLREALTRSIRETAEKRGKGTGPVHREDLTRTERRELRVR